MIAVLFVTFALSKSNAAIRKSVLLMGGRIKLACS